MTPLRSLVEVRIVVGPPALIRYNNMRAVTVLGSPAPGISSGGALTAMEQVAAKTLPAGFAGEWTDTSLGEARRRQDRDDPAARPQVQRMGPTETSRSVTAAAVE
jgi:multidrug efflux pump subunit AcrB